MDKANHAKIFLVLTDDWELRGDGSGNIRQIMFQNMRFLVGLYDRWGIKGSFFAEVMQQLTFRKLQGQFPGLKQLADEWEEHVIETYRAGHDIQLHIHPQWADAVYENGAWDLKGNWSLLHHSREAVSEMIRRGKAYLESLLRPIDPDYRCVAFRAGSWCIAPSPYLLDILAQENLRLDVSIVGGLHYKSPVYQLDFRDCQETFLPYYPDLADARKISPTPQRIVCVPTFHYYEPIAPIIRRLLRKAVRRLFKKQPAIAEPSSGGMDVPATGPNRRSRWNFDYFLRLLRTPFTGVHRIADFSGLDFSAMDLMINKVRIKASQTGLAEVPVVLENHTKSIRDFNSMDRFFEKLAASPDIEFLTLSQLNDALTQKRFPVRMG